MPIREHGKNRAYFSEGGGLVVFAMQAQFAACPAAAMFLHVPACAVDVVHAFPPPQIVPPNLLTQGPAETSPMLCTKPGKPVSLEHVLA